MATWIARDCGCKQEVYAGQRRPQRCVHGNLFESQKVIEARDNRLSQPSKKSSEPKRDWTDAQIKLEEEGCCRICKRSNVPLEKAHILGREHDEPKVSKATGEILKDLYVHPDRIIPACGPFPAGCHGLIHAHEINLVHHLTIEEQIRAVKDAGGIAQAWVELTRPDRREERQAAAYSPGEAA